MIRLVALLAFLIGWSSVAQAGEVILDDAHEAVRVGAAMEIAYDPGASFGFAEVQGGALAFAPAPREVPSFGYREGIEWARFTVTDRRASPSDLVLEQGQGVADLVEVAVVDGSGALHVVGRAGDHVPQAERAFPRHRLPAVRIAAGARTIYVRLQSRASHQLAYELFTARSFEEHAWADATLQWLYFGGLALIGVFSAFVAIATRSATYGRYVGFLALYMLFQAAFGGQLAIFVDAAPPHALDWCVVVAMALTSGAAAAFGSHFLRLEEKRPREARALRFIVVASAAVPALGVVLPIGVCMKGNIAVGLVGIVVVLWAAVALAARGDRSARLYLLAWGALIGGTALNGLRVVGAVPTNAFTTNAQQLGSLAEFVLLSFALADQIRALQEEIIAQGHRALASANEALAARELAMHELEERRRLQGELDTATHQLAQAENMATLGMLMAGIAHDLRNPLNYVQNAAEQLKVTVPDLRSASESRREEAVAVVEQVSEWVETGAHAMDAISLAMRNQARPGGGDHDEVRVADVVREALVLCRSRTKLAELEVQVSDGLVRLDATGLGQLVMNLVSNAADALAEHRHAASARAPRILVRAFFDANRFALEVHDSGPGVPDDLRTRILEPFFTTKPRGQGTGLGLAIVQRVIREHGGTLRVERSTLLGGALFVAQWTRAEV
jgi:signal transduction histidine kinase